MLMFHGRYDAVTDIIRRHWDGRAVTFDREIGHGLHSHEQRRSWLALLARLAGAPPQRILDVGCGTGFLALMFAELGHNVTGIDFAPQMLDVAREKAQRATLSVEFRVENASLLSDPDATYDLVIARHVIWALPDPARGVAEWRRVLRHGGRVALIEGKWTNNEPLAKAYLRPARAVLDAIINAVLAIVSYRSGRERQRYYSRKYRRIQTQLPFSGGPTRERLVTFLSTHGLHDVAWEPLMSPVLWGETPPFPRYLVVGSR